MKFSQSTIVYYCYSLRYAIKDLHELGYDGVEIYGGRPHMYRNDLDEQLDEILGMLKEFSMEVPDYVPAQFRYPCILSSGDEKVRRESVEYLKAGVDNAIKVGAPKVDLCPGWALIDSDIGQAWKRLLKSYEELAEYIEDKDVVFVIEPGHKLESNLILTIDECLRMIDQVKSPKFGILLDTGHCNVNGEDLTAVIPKCKGLPLHVHVDDNRGDSDSHLIPGKGNVDFEALANALSEIGYDGYVSGELGPSYILDPTSACRETLDILRRLFGTR